MHLPRQTRHEDGGTAECCIGDRADHAGGGDAAPFELREDRCLQWHRASNPLLPLAVGHPPAQHILLAKAVPLDRQPVDDRRETAGEPLPSHYSGTVAKGLFDPCE